MSDIRQALRSELESTAANVQVLEAQISSTQERLRVEIDKVDRIKGLLLIYEAEAEAAKPTVPPPPLTTTPTTPPSVRGTVPRRISKKTRMEHEVAALLALRGSVHRNHILEHLSKSGIMGTEKNPLAHLAAFLSDHKAQFVSDGRGVFSLRPSAPQQTASVPQDDQQRSPKEAASADVVMAS
jgi:hypothetical protein